MAALRERQLWQAAGGAAFLLYLVAVVAGLVRVVDQPAIVVHLSGTDASLVPADAVLGALAVVTVLHLARRGGIPSQSRTILLTAAVFAAWLVATAVPNGGAAVVAAGRLLELSILALATAVLVRRLIQLWLLVATLATVATVAVGVAFVDFLGDTGARQASFLGEHDLSALSTMVLTAGLAAIVSGHGAPRLAWAAVGVGALGLTLGAALASLLGLYLAAAVIALIAATRGTLRRRGLLASTVVLVAITAGTLEVRSGDLGFLQVLIGTEEKTPGQFASSWSQRLIFAYVGLRVFESSPIVGTGWYPLLPPDEFARFLPDARERFSDQPARYFPPADGAFIPQQTPDQILYELGLIGVALLVALGVAIARSARRVALAWPRGPDDVPAYVPAAWAASLLGVLAGAALFGGTPIAAILWLTVGVVAAAPRLAAAGPEPSTA